MLPFLANSQELEQQDEVEHLVGVHQEHDVNRTSQGEKPCGENGYGFKSPTRSPQS